MKTWPVFLVLLVLSGLSVPAFARHAVQQGTITETHTVYLAGNRCELKSTCPKTEAVLVSGDRVYHLTGSKHWPELFHTGQLVSFDFVKAPDLFIMAGDKRLKFWVTDIEVQSTGTSGPQNGPLTKTAPGAQGASLP